MLSFLTFIVWDPIPEVIPGWSVPRWYGLLFAMGFLVSQQILTQIFKKEGKPEQDVGTLTIYIVIATIVGARLGHVFFYDAGHYLSNPIDIFKIWEGGLASHGGAIGILIALIFYIKTREDQTYLWLVDRLVIVVAITGCLIRMGNYMNSEILGKPTESEFGVVFARQTEFGLERAIDTIEDVEARKGTGDPSDANFVPLDLEITFAQNDVTETQMRNHIENDIKQQLVAISSYGEKNIYEPQGVPLKYELTKRNNIYKATVHTNGIARHPAQLYESFYCLLLFFFLYFIWNKMKEKTPEGLLFGLFMVILWSLRFVDEYFKENQKSFEDELPLNMGQILSIPLVMVGLFVLFKTWQKHNKQVKEEK